MQFQDYYATLGVERDATPDTIKRAFRKLARKYHPDVSKEPDAEARFKEVAEAYKALKDPEKRAAYDQVGRNHHKGESFEPPPDWGSGYSYSGRGDEAGDGAEFSDFFASLFGRGAGNHANGHARGSPFGADPAAQGADRHARIVIDLQDAYHGANRTITLRVPAIDAQGRTAIHEKQLAVNIPRGIRAGQHLRLAGQGSPGSGGLPAGDLYLEIALNPDARFRVDGADVYMDLPVAPWEAALGATMAAPTPDGPVQLTVPPGSAPGRKLRLRGRGLPATAAGAAPGDMYVLLAVGIPPSDTDAEKAAYADMARAFPHYAPRGALEA
jgi:curved DNA-binding protein